MSYSAFWQIIKEQEQQLALLSHREILDAVSGYLTAHFPHISAEVSKGSSKPFTLIFTAHGDIEYFNDILLLTRSAPALTQFEVEAFRQRADLSGFDMKMGEFSLNTKEINVDQKAYQGRVALTLSFSKGIPDDMADHAKNMAFILLDHALGEFDFAVKVGPVDFVDNAENPGAVPLQEYSVIFDHFWHHELGHNGQFPQGEHEWTGIELTSRDNPDDRMVVLHNRSANSLVCRADLSERLDACAILHDSETLEFTRQFEDKLDNQLRTYQEGLCCQTTLRSGIRCMSWYVTDKDSALIKAKNLAKEYPEVQFEFNVEFDPAWSSYLRWSE